MNPFKHSRRRRRNPMRIILTVVLILVIIAAAFVVCCTTGDIPEECIALAAPVEPKPLYDEAELEMLACVIYQEAGADATCDDCRRRVADVVLNRVEDERFPDTMHEVLTQERQYGRYHWTGIVWPERALKPEEAHAVERAYRIAEEVLLGQHSELYGRGYIWQAEFKQGTTTLECCDIYFGK